MARKPSTVFSCGACGAQSPRWIGRCPECGGWNTFVEESAAPPARAGSPGKGPVAAARRLSEIPADDAPRIPSGLLDFDRVLGGGLVPGSVVLLGGEPGIGKSTLLLQVAARLSARLGPVLYVSAEESGRQLRMRAERLGSDGSASPSASLGDGYGDVFVLAETSLERILETAADPRFTLLVVDSVQTIASEELSSAAGSVSQVRACAARLSVLAKTSSRPLVLIGHVTKDGTLAGPKTLEHLVDAVLSFEGERFHAQRVIRALKNRFGPVHEMGIFEMTGQGLREVANPSALFLGSGAGLRPGSVVLASVEGTRPLLVEVQALTVETRFGTPRRTAIGFDTTRLALLLAVLERHGGLSLGAQDVFLNFAGGAESGEPAADLAVVAAVASSAKGRALPASTVVFGEVGLLGEVRPVTDASRRLREAASVGFRAAALPAGNAAEAAEFPDLQVTPARTVDELLARLLGP